MTDNMTPAEALNKFIEEKAEVLAGALEKQRDTWFTDEFEERWGVEHLRSYQGQNDPNTEMDAFYNIEEMVWERVLRQTLANLLTPPITDDDVTEMVAEMQIARAIDGN